MAYVIGAPCIGTTDRSCVDVCPVDCISADDGDQMLFIDPTVCIDCGACVEPCPVEAIKLEKDVPAEWSEFIGINRLHFEDPKVARELVESWLSRQ